MKNMKLTFLYIIAVVIILGGLLFFYAPAGKTGTSETSAQYDTFSQCLSEAGAKFYGAFWCPHCQEQKALFKNSTKLPYIECSTPDGENQMQVCIDEGIKGYPHWKFADGTELTGVQQFAALAAKTNCVIP